LLISDMIVGTATGTTAENEYFASIISTITNIGTAG